MIVSPRKDTGTANPMVVSRFHPEARTTYRSNEALLQEIARIAEKKSFYRREQRQPRIAQFSPLPPGGRIWPFSAVSGEIKFKSGRGRPNPPIPHLPQIALEFNCATAFFCASLRLFAATPLFNSL
jgi:hypothetical protein